MTTVDAGMARAATLRRADATLGEVIENKALTASGKPVKGHIGKCALYHFVQTRQFFRELEMPEGYSYRAGDYLAV
jgi:hypothetical protein